MAYRHQLHRRRKKRHQQARVTKQLSSMGNTFRLLDGILISSILYAHIYNNLQVNLLHTYSNIYRMLTCSGSCIMGWKRHVCGFLWSKWYRNIDKNTIKAPNTHNIKIILNFAHISLIFFCVIACKCM